MDRSPPPSDSGPPGSVRCPDGPSVADILRRDGDGAPDYLAPSWRNLGDADIDFRCYYTQDFFQTEIDRLWQHVWQWACREEAIPEPGDYIVYDVGPHSLIVVRGDDRVIRAFHNSCLHRGTKLRSSGSEGSAAELRCPFHGWTWKLDGSLHALRCRWDFPHVQDGDFVLPQAKVALWGGFVFINMDTDCAPLEDHLGVLPEHFRTWDLAERYTAIHIEKELPCNWKLALEAFIENYHTAETHPQLLRSGDDENTQYDLFGDMVGRFHAPKGVPSPSLQEPVSEAEMLASMVRDKTVLGEGGAAVNDGATARTVMAAHLRKSFSATLGRDYSTVSTAEMIDTIEYNLFPNMVLFIGITLPMVYRFRPLGMDPERSLFEILFLRPFPAGTPRPEPACPVRLAADDSYALVPGIDAGFAGVFDQDTGNLGQQQEGIRASRKGTQTLANYAESRIRQFHQTLDKFLQGAAP